MTTPHPSGSPLFRHHERDHARNRYVYPVLSRRAGGISLGVNINRDKACNFDCAYCQVDRDGPATTAEPIDLEVLRRELEAMVDQVLSGGLFQGTKFSQTPDHLRRLNDFALSGDGEPTMHADFPAVAECCADVRRRLGADQVKLVLLTNASLLHQPRVARALEVLDQNNGEIWAKLDAGTEDYYRRIARSSVPFARILENIEQAAQRRPIVIQTLWMLVDGQPPADEQIDAYCDRLRTVVARGGRIKLVQVHTVARRPAESWVAPLDNARLDAIADRIAAATGLTLKRFYGG